MIYFTSNKTSEVKRAFHKADIVDYNSENYQLIGYLSP